MHPPSGYSSSIVNILSGCFLQIGVCLSLTEKVSGDGPARLTIMFPIEKHFPVDLADGYGGPGIDLDLCSFVKSDSG